METFVEFAKYGQIGVIIALIGTLVFTIRLLYRMATNHMQHSNMAFNENTKALTQLTDIIKELKNNLK